MIEIKMKDERISFNELYEEFKEFLYPFIFYNAGLLLISLVFYRINESLGYFMDKCFIHENESLVFLLIHSFSLYFTVFSITVFLGMCLIGYPLINLIPLIFGIVTGCKICYFYVNYGFSGIAYSLLLIIPEATAFLITLFFTIKNSCQLSKTIYSLATKKSDTNEVPSFKSYLINYLKYAAFVAIIATANSLVTALLQSIITL